MAIVLVLCAVFVPVAFIGGVKGELFKQFAVTIVISVLLSGMVALTLTPALCGLLLKESHRGEHTTGFFGWFNRTFDRGRGSLRAHRGRRAAPSGAVVRGCSWWSSRWRGFCWVRTPTAFIPTEDKGYMALSVQLPGCREPAAHTRPWCSTSRRSCAPSRRW